MWCAAGDREARPSGCLGKKAGCCPPPWSNSSRNRRSLAIGALIPPEAEAQAVRLRARLRAELAATMREVDVLMLPTTPQEAGDLDAGDAFSRPDSAPYTRPFSLVGVPAATVPCGLGPRGRPLGLQLVGRHGEDARLLAIAASVEAVMPAIGRPEEWWR